MVLLGEWQTGVRIWHGEGDLLVGDVRRPIRIVLRILNATFEGKAVVRDKYFLSEEVSRQRIFSNVQESV